MLNTNGDEYQMQHSEKVMQNWLAVDLDGTLAEYHGFQGVDHIGNPVPSVVEALKERYRQGWKIAIFTARLEDDDGTAESHIVKWLMHWDIPSHEITNKKRKVFREFWDDRAVQIIPNVGFEKDVCKDETCSLDVQIGGNHYSKMVIQPAEYCEYNNIPALEAAVIKYVSRHQDKNGVQDLEKAKDLINMIIDMRYDCVGIANLEARLAKLRQSKTDGVKND